MGSLPFLINLSETLQNLDLSLFKCLLLGLELVLEPLDGKVFARLNMSALIDMPETAAAYQLLLLKLVEQDDFAFRRRTHGSGRLLSTDLDQRALTVLHACGRVVIRHLLTVHFSAGLYIIIVANYSF